MLRLLDKIEGFPVGLQADQNSDFLGLLQGWIEHVKAADEKVPNENIKEARIVAQEVVEAVAEGVALLIR